ncbi:MAG TPA: type II secretion system protein GspL [Usitatibacter sp.]|nr:type II secretion system protein GspL [Usitatibacter sp.]
MKLRIFLPPVERADPNTRFAWMLFDGRRGLLREGTSVLAEIPRGDEVEAVLPASRVLFARLKLPKVSAATIRELLPFAVEDRLLADPSHIHAVPGAKGAKGETVVAVIDREWLQAMLNAMGRAGIRPTRAWPESELLMGGHGDWNLVWSPARGMLVDDDGVATTFDHDASGAFPLALRLALDEAAARGERPDGVRVHTEAGAPLPSLDRWNAESGIRFAPGSQWEKLAQADFPAGAVNLMQGEFSPRRAMRTRLPRAAVALFIVIAALQMSFVAIDAGRLRHERTRLEAQREAIFRDAFPDARAVVDPELQMKRNLAELRRAHGIGGEDEFLGKLSRAAHESGGRAKSVDFANGKLELRAP